MIQNHEVAAQVLDYGSRASTLSRADVFRRGCVPGPRAASRRALVRVPASRSPPQTHRARSVSSARAARAGVSSASRRVAHRAGQGLHLVGHAEVTREGVRRRRDRRHLDARRLTEQLRGQSPFAAGSGVEPRSWAPVSGICARGEGRIRRPSKLRRTSSHSHERERIADPVGRSALRIALHSSIGPEHAPGPYVPREPWATASSGPTTSVRRQVSSSAAASRTGSTRCGGSKWCRPSKTSRWKLGKTLLKRSAISP